MKKFDRLTVKIHNQTVGSLTLTNDGRLCVFEYDSRWLAEGFSISPLDLPLRREAFVAKPHPFAGNFGVFEDSLPDGYGRYLLHKALAREGIDDRNLTSLDRLSFVGDNGMGALCYEPNHTIEDGCLINDFDLLQAKALEVLKEKQDNDAELLLFNSGNSGGARPKAVFSDADGHWLVKFRHTYDPMDIGLQEYHYNKTAVKCGIKVSDFKLMNGKYFTSRRFDIDKNNERIHTITAGGLLGISLNEPFMDYSNLLALTGYLTQNTAEVEQMFRRMVFNYITDNKDDHCKNFSFMIDRNPDRGWCWKLAPAYDLTLCTEGYNGEHATSVNGKGLPAIEDFVAVGTKYKISESVCRRIIDEIISVCRDEGIERYKI